MHKFSSDVVLPRERFDVWGDFLERTVMPVRIEPAGEHPFHVEIAARTLAELPLISIAGAGCNAVRGRSEIARTSDHFYLVSMHLGGATSLITWRGEQHLACGDIFIVDTMHEIKFGLDRPYQHLIVKLPKGALDARVPRPDLLCGSVLSHKQPLSRLLASYINTGFELADQLCAAEATMFAHHSLDLLSEAFTGPQAHQPPHSKAWRAAVFFRACRLIALKFSDPDLRPNLIAAQLGISTRMLHRIFAEHGATVMRHVLKERIGRARKLLASSQSRGRTITEIAFACGFNDLTHFGRVFCEEVGVTPSEWRRALGEPETLSTYRICLPEDSSSCRAGRHAASEPRKNLAPSKT